MDIRKTILSGAAALILCATATAQTVKVPERYTFAGQTVELTRQDMYERMDREIITFTYMHTTSILMLKRSAIYFPVVEPILKEYGLPDDLKYIMVIESNLDPKARSSAGAAGLWQLMTATAKEQGLEVNANVDERYHIEKATRAACKILKASYAKYGDWLTVAAAYNAGQGGISKRMTDQNESKATDLWLVEETSRYMFRIMAAKMMFENPASFGFIVLEADKYRRNPPKEIVTTRNEIANLVNFANNHGVSYMELKNENLWLREDKLNNASHREYKIIIPDVIR
ncbi:MAG: lytic transglycosylase domain-containing protein [Bacteroidales bacterium]|nr:lytic transglycosylase domain-containing protein [Bacteroidales bacterium]